MLIHCPACKQDYDDVMRETSCPHRTFEMHCGVMVKGVLGCAHTIAELESTEAPNVDCFMNRLVEAVANDEPLAGYEDPR